jgi:uncharacterized protein YndB with AHSA1/START domain
MQKGIKQTWYFDQPVHEIWEYLTRPELIEQWLMKSDFEPVAGHKFRFTFIPKDDSHYDGTIDSEVLEVIPFKKLSYSWNGSANDGSRTFRSIVVWTLIPKGNGTELQLQHDGFTLPEDILTHANGWKSCVKRLEESLNDLKNDNTNT